VPDDNYLGSVSSVLTQVVNKSTTTITLGSAPSPSNYGQPVTFTAAVVGAGAGTPTGTMTFKLGSTVLGTVSLDATGVGTYTTTAFQLPGGNQVITAVYSGDGVFQGSTAILTQTVNAVASSTTIASSANPASFGAPVTFTATVTSSIPGSAVPTGQVSFILDGSITLGTGVLNSAGIATFTAGSGQLPLGTHTITAQYAGNANYATSSDSLSQAVGSSTSTTGVTAAPAQGVKRRAITFTAHVAAGSGTPTGLVAFKDTTTGWELGTASLDASGNAVLVHFLGGPNGKHTITATYLGDGSYEASAGATTVNVIPNGTRTSVVGLKQFASPAVQGAPITFTATVFDTGAAPAVNPGGTEMCVDTSRTDPITGKPVVLGYAILVAV
jgi:hypothetical protein